MTNTPHDLVDITTPHDLVNITTPHDLVSGTQNVMVQTMGLQSVVGQNAIAIYICGWKVTTYVRMGVMYASVCAKPDVAILLEPICANVRKYMCDDRCCGTLKLEHRIATSEVDCV